MRRHSARNNPFRVCDNVTLLVEFFHRTASLNFCVRRRGRRSAPRGGTHDPQPYGAQLVSAAALAATHLAFEVASIRPSARKENVDVGDQRDDAQHAPHRALSDWAYNVSSPSHGPDWLNLTRFDIVPKGLRPEPELHDDANVAGEAFNIQFASGDEGHQRDDSPWQGGHKLKRSRRKARRAYRQASST